MSETGRTMVVFGKSFDVSVHNGIGYALLGLRLAIGWIFLTSGLSKMAEYGLMYDNASRYLAEAVPVATPAFETSFPEVLSLPLKAVVYTGSYIANPLFTIIESVPYIGALVVIFEVMIGIGVFIGAFTRLFAKLGAFMMFLFYYGNAEWSHGLINGDMMYLLVFVAVATAGAGRIWGVDSLIEKRLNGNDYTWLNYLLG